MTFIIGWGFAERRILKKWNWSYLLNWVEYFDRLLHKQWYWQDLAQEIVKCHFSSVEILLSSKFWKSENGPIFWTEWNIVMKFAYTLVLTRCSQLTNDIWYWLRSKSEKNWNLTLKPFGLFWWNFADNLMLKWSSPRNCKMTFIIGRGFDECPNLLNWVEYFDKLLRNYWYWQDLAQEIANWHFYRSWLCRAQILKKSENGPISWTVKKYCDEILHTHWYWQDVANEIVKWHLGLVEVLLRFKY